MFFAKACELLVREMALRAYVEATDQKRRIVSVSAPVTMFVSVIVL